VGPRVGLDNVEKRKFLTLPGLELQPVASRYTDCATPAPTLYIMALPKTGNDTEVFWSNCDVKIGFFSIVKKCYRLLAGKRDACPPSNHAWPQCLHSSGGGKSNL
jgi:hypothetical protein